MTKKNKFNVGDILVHSQGCDKVIKVICDPVTRLYSYLIDNFTYAFTEKELEKSGVKIMAECSHELDSKFIYSARLHMFVFECLKCGEKVYQEPPPVDFKLAGRFKGEQKE